MYLYQDSERPVSSGRPDADRINCSNRNGYGQHPDTEKRERQFDMKISESLLNRLRRLFERLSEGKSKAADPQISFKQRYQTFRSLLTANNNALELMMEMEQMLIGGCTFGMTFIRSRCSALTFQVYKMIRNLQKLSGNGYDGLLPAFQAVSDSLDKLLAGRTPSADGPYILEMSEIDRHQTDLVGEKMANLGEIANRVGLSVPDGFVITAVAANYFLAADGLRDEINRRLTICDTENLEELYTTSAAIQGLISRLPLPVDLEIEMNEACRRLIDRTGKRDLLLAMRSSALGEDGGFASFAGQYRTQLNIAPDMLSPAYREIVAGKYRSQAISYRLQRGFRHQDVVMCVGCLAMIESRFGGVMYSREPFDHRSPYVVISSTTGLTDRVVEGRADADLFQVERESPHSIRSQIRRSRTEEESPTDRQIVELTRIAVLLENHFGIPQDIEWSIDHQGKIFILQSRPLAHFVDSAWAPSSDIADAEVLLTGGIIASRGVGCGPVCIVRSDLDLLRFPKGSVLVVEHPLPDWATLLPRAVAIISETGQITAHLATVSREFGIPAIFGVREATTRLIEKQIVTVDSIGCRIYDGRNEEVLSQPNPKPNMMKDSPIFRILEEALTHIAPLNLTDPASPFFRSTACKTLHDLTRFCHEKAVSEMFSSRTQFKHDRRAARQLVGETPYMWWVINLDDGFREHYDARNRFVSLEDIDSPPMEAIWEGMTSKPWSGPPPVDIRGLGSIIFRSTMNPSLDPAVRSPMINKNYFLISRNFCNLSIRLGYHFAMVETYLGDMLTENYVSFQFKGGGADRERRLTRIQLIGEVLERLGFHIELRMDSLSARIEKKPGDYLRQRLRGLGYLLIHTRQIDMVMGEQAMVGQYLHSIKLDLKSLFDLILD